MVAVCINQECRNVYMHRGLQAYTIYREIHWSWPIAMLLDSFQTPVWIRKCGRPGFQGTQCTKTFTTNTSACVRKTLNVFLMYNFFSGAPATLYKDLTGYPLLIWVTNISFLMARQDVGNTREARNQNTEASKVKTNVLHVIKLKAFAE